MFQILENSSLNPFFTIQTLQFPVYVRKSQISFSTSTLFHFIPNWILGSSTEISDLNLQVQVQN